MEVTDRNRLFLGDFCIFYKSIAYFYKIRYNMYVSLVEQSATWLVKIQ